MIAAASVLCGIAANAASINWGAAVASPDDLTGNTEATAGYVAYLLYSSTSLGSIATELDKTGIGAIANNGASVVSTYTLTSADVNDMWAFSTEYVATDVNGYYQILVVDEASGKFGAANQTFTVTGITDLNSPGEVLYNNDFSLGYDHFAGETGWSGSVAPEPTSGLLMLVGLAGLALKRKRA